MNRKTITFHEPKGHDFHCERDENGKRTCYPISMGFGCYGDCMDCASMWIERYSNMKENK